MKRRKIQRALVAASMAAASAFASAQTEAESRGGFAATQPAMHPLLGADVRTMQGEKIGAIEAVLTDAHGNPTLALVSTGEFLGLGARMHAVPYEALEAGASGTHRLLDMSREQLRRAPHFSMTEPPDMRDPAWRIRNMRSYEPREAASFQPTAGALQ